MCYNLLQVIGNIAVPTTFTTNTELVLRAVDLQSEGKPGNVAFDTKVILNQLKNSENSNARTSGELNLRVSNNYYSQCSPHD